MEERELKFKSNFDETLVSLDEKGLARFKKAQSEFYFPCAELSKHITEGTLEVGYKETLITLIEAKVRDFTRLLGYDGVLEKEHKERYAEIRQLNTENRELRKQLGQKCSPEDVRESLKNLSESFKRWWNINGFGHCSEESFGPYGFKANLSGMITEAYYDKTDKDATEESKIEKLQLYGFQIRGEGDSRHDRKILYNDHNIKLLEVMLKDKYPSVCIHYSKAWHGNRHDDSEIREVEIFIRNFDELF